MIDRRQKTVDMTAANNPIFREVQRFSQPLRLFALVSMAAGGTILAIVMARRGSEENSVSLLGQMLALIAVLGVGVLFFTVRLETEVRPDGLYVRFFPFHVHYRRFSAADIAQYYARTYRPILEYGGWGIRCGRKGRAYNMKGNRGVQLVFTDGKQLLIGSQKPEELVEAIRSVKSP